MNKGTKWSKWNSILGPGILFASAAIGVSHLVQSTRAGANYGYALLFVVIAANVFKYPFFEYGSRYANATGESIIDGYLRLGKWTLWIYLFVTLGSMFFVTAAVGLVTAGFLDNLLGLSQLWPSFELFPITLLFCVCLGILIIGKFSALDSIIKILGAALFFSTLIAVISVAIYGQVEQSPGFIPVDVFDEAGLLFIIALMGWMPTALDLSSWNSLWTVEKMKLGYTPLLKETIFEFNLGYWIAAGLSICFIFLGKNLIYGTDTKIPADSVGFANKVVELYSETIGQWSYFPIAVCTFSIMFGTIVTVFDGYSRSIERTLKLLFLSKKEAQKDIHDRKVYVVCVFVLAVGAFAIVSLFLANFKYLIDLATTISFLIAPLVAIANFRLINTKFISEKALPPKWMVWLSYTGIIFLIGFAIFYCYIKFV